MSDNSGISSNFELQLRIEALEKKLDMIDTIATSTAIGTDTLPNQIAELKGRYEGVDANLTYFVHKYHKTEEVLRWLLIRVKDWRSFVKNDDWHIQFGEQLEKLDSPKIDYSKPFQRITRADGSIEESQMEVVIKDSGGEKEKVKK